MRLNCRPQSRTTSASETLSRPALRYVNKTVAYKFQNVGQFLLGLYVLSANGHKYILLLFGNYIDIRTSPANKFFFLSTLKFYAEIDSF